MARLVDDVGFLLRMLQNIFLIGASAYFFIWALPYGDNVFRGVVGFFGRLAEGG